jgi:hypothetical protein
MKPSDLTELARAILDASSIANLLDRLTPEESGLASYELRLLRAHTWALVDGLQSLAVGQPKIRAEASATAAIFEPVALLDRP